MSRYPATIAVAAAGVMLLATSGASAGGSSDDGGSDTTFRPRNWQSVFIQRYPGDQALAGGTVRTEGPERGPYVERCNWSANPGVFGLPFGLTQTCRRYTLENTPE